MERTPSVLALENNEHTRELLMAIVCHEVPQKGIEGVCETEHGKISFFSEAKHLIAAFRDSFQEVVLVVNWGHGAREEVFTSLGLNKEALRRVLIIGSDCDPAQIRKEISVSISPFGCDFVPKVNEFLERHFPKNSALVKKKIDKVGF